MNRMLLSIMVVLLGCGDSDPSYLMDGGPLDAAADSAQLPPNDLGVDAAADGAVADPPISVWYFRGDYFVPQRRDVSTYPVFEATWTQRGERVGLFYNLPRMLTGASFRVAMTGTIDGDVANLSGPLGTAVCQLGPQRLPVSCLEEFVGIEVDLERVRREAERDDPGRVDARVDVAMQFGTEPIGVLESGSTLLGPTGFTACSRASDCPSSLCEMEHPEVSFCTPLSPNRLTGEPCALDFECAAGLKCDHKARVCEPQ